MHLKSIIISSFKNLSYNLTIFPQISKLAKIETKSAVKDLIMKHISATSCIRFDRRIKFIQIKLVTFMAGVDFRVHISQP